MYRIEYSDGYVQTFDNKSEWEEEIESIADETCFDIDVNDNIATIDCGDYDDEE